LNGEQIWWQHGIICRKDGPAWIKPDGTQLWFWNGEPVTKEEHDELREQSESI
jgi:hypothetical protein